MQVAQISLIKEMPENGAKTRVDIFIDGGKYGVVKIELILMKVNGPVSMLGNSMEIKFEEGNKNTLYNQLEKIKKFLNTGQFPK